MIDQLIALDDERKKLQTELDNLLSETNTTSKEIGKLMGQGKNEEAEEMKKRVSELKIRSGDTENKHNEIAESIKNILLTLPNLPQEIVPDGKTPEELFLNQKESLALK